MADKRVRIVSCADAGCEISAEEHLEFCRLVSDTVTMVYGCECECEVEDVFSTRVYIYGKWENMPTTRDILALHQEVWEQGGFWSI